MVCQLPTQQTTVLAPSHFLVERIRADRGYNSQGGEKRGGSLPAEARGKAHVCVLRVPRGRGGQRPAPAVYVEGEWVWSVAVPREAPRWRGRRCFAFSLKTNWAFLAWSSDNPPLWVTSRKGRYRGICLQLSEPPQHAHHPCSSSKRSCYFQLAGAPFQCACLPATDL